MEKADIAQRHLAEATVQNKSKTSPKPVCLFKAKPAELLFQLLVPLPIGAVVGLKPNQFQIDEFLLQEKTIVQLRWLTTYHLLQDGTAGKGQR